MVYKEECCSGECQWDREGTWARKQRSAVGPAFPHSGMSSLTCVIVMMSVDSAFEMEKKKVVMQQRCVMDSDFSSASPRHLL